MLVCRSSSIGCYCLISGKTVPAKQPQRTQQCSVKDSKQVPPTLPPVPAACGSSRRHATRTLLADFRRAASRLPLRRPGLLQSGDVPAAHRPPQCSDLSEGRGGGLAGHNGCSTSFIDGSGGTRPMHTRGPASCRAALTALPRLALKLAPASSRGVTLGALTKKHS